MSYKKILILFITNLSIISFSCTLNYSGEAKKFKKKPNFVFKNANLDRYEQNSLSLKVNFEVLEIYDSDKIWAGEKISFIKLKKPENEEKIQEELKGSAGVIKIDEKENKYFLGKNVAFEDLKENISILGDAFFWDKNANILYGTENGIVSVKKGLELSIRGTGFAADTLSRKLEFSKSVEGLIETEKDKEISEAENIDE